MAAKKKKAARIRTPEELLWREASPMRRCRNALWLSTREAARQSGLSKQKWWDTETGRVPKGIRLDTLLRIVETLGVPLGWFVEEFVAWKESEPK